MRPVVDVFPVTIGHYADAGLPDLDVESQAGRLVELLAPFGGEHRPWRHPVRDRGADAAQHRLREWSGPQAAAVAGTDEPDGFVVNPVAGSSVLYWAGRGWSDGTHAALAHAGSPAMVGGSGIEPQQLAQAIRARQATAAAAQNAADAGGWAMIIVETSHATQIADAVMAALHGPDAPARLLLIAAPHDGTGPAGWFTGVLANLLADTYRAERRILLRDLAAQLERVIGPHNVHQRALGEAALVRVYPPVASWMAAPVETISYLEEVLADLSADERNHFLVKAQGAEHGELAWFFEGRENELAQISAWLHRADSGMLVVTGRAGAGKSALLGTVLVRSLPALRDALARRGLAAIPGPGTTLPPESVFDAVIHLSGLNLAQAVMRAAAAAGIGPLPSDQDSATGVASDLDFLTAELAGRTGPFTVLADALDESVDPLDIARSLLARIASLARVRVLVGTRASTSEAPDRPAGDENLLDALGTGTAGTRGPAGGPAADGTDRGRQSRGCVIWLSQDREAIRRYVCGRLRAARDYGVAGHAIAHMRAVSDQDIRRVAGEVADRGQEFLFARLVVCELTADPRLLTPSLARSRGQLLQGTHQDGFGRALHRLAGQDDHYPILMRALSLARGRGVPEADGIWAAIAAALAPNPLPRLAGDSDEDPSADPDFNVAGIWAAAISGLLGQAAAYITADTATRHGGTSGAQTVYRLAHHTFIEYFAGHPPAGQDGGDPRRLTARALLHAAQAAAATEGRFPDYLVRHLSGHIAEAGRWDDLAGLPRVLDRLDPNAVTADAIRTLFGHRAVPPPIAGIMGARDTLVSASPADRPGLRQLATTRHSPRQVIGEPATGWGIAAAQAGRSTVHVSLSGHTSAVNKVRSLTLPSGRLILASCGDDGTIRLWDPVTATPIGVPMQGHTSSVEDICVLSMPAGRTLLASAGDDGTVRLWDPATGQPTGPVITGHTGPIWGLCVLPGRQPPTLASAGDDGTVRLWDPATGQPTSPVITGHTGAVLGLCMLPGSQPDQPLALASAGGDGTVRLWDPATGQPTGPVITGHTGAVPGLCVLPGRKPGQPPTLASAGDDGTVRLWDRATGQPTSHPITGHTGTVWDVCVLPGSQPDQPPTLASAGQDGTIRLWDPATGQPTSHPITGHTGPVWGLCVLPGRQPPTLASAGDDGTVRLWDPATGQPTSLPATGAILGLCVLPGRRPDQRPTLASAGDDGTIRLWDPATGQPTGPVITGHTGSVWDICMVPGQPPTLASAGRDGTVRLWDPATGQPTSHPITGHTGTVWSVCVLPGRRPGQPPTLASAGRDGTIRQWDPLTGQPTGPVITGHTSAVLGLCVLPGRPPTLASAGHAGTIRQWDPATGQPTGPVITGHTGPIWDVCVLPGRQPGQPPIMASAGQDGTVRLWDTTTGRAVGQPLVRSPVAVSGLAPCPAMIGDCVTMHGDGTVRSWTAATATQRTVTSPAEVSAIATLTRTDHLSLLTGNIHGQVRLSDLRTGYQPGPPLQVSDQAVLALCPLPGQPPEARAAVADGTGTITIITVFPGGHLKPGPTVRGPASPIRALCPITLPDGHLLLAAAGNDATIRIWDLAAILPSTPDARQSPTPVNSPLTGHDGWIWALTAIPSRPGLPPLLASASADHTIRVWDPASGRAAGRPLTGHTGQVRAVLTAISDDGHMVLISGGHDGTVRLWDPATGTPHTVIPLGIPVHALLQQRPSHASRERTEGGATLTVGLRTGILALDLHRDLFHRTPEPGL